MAWRAGAVAHGAPGPRHAGSPRRSRRPAAAARRPTAQATAAPGVAAMVLTADCLPVALVGAGRRRDGPRRLARAGRRGPRGGRRGRCAGSAAAARRGRDRARRRRRAATRSATRSTRLRATAPRARPNLDLKAIARERLEAAGVDEVHDVGLCTICRPERCSSPTAATAASPAARRGSRGGADPRARRRARAREPRARPRRDRARAGRDPGDVEILAAVKYVAARGARRARRGRARRSWARTARRTSRPRPHAYPGAFTWDFIGHLQSRKVKQILPLVRYIHSVASDSALAQLGRHGTPETRGAGRGQRRRRGGQERGRARRAATRSSTRCPVPRRRPDDDAAARRDPEDSRRWFAALRELAARARPARSSRWARRRTTRSRSRRARRSCASARGCTLTGGA